MKSGRAAGTALATTVFSVVALVSCGSDDSGEPASATAQRPEFSDFDPCNDVSPDFVARHELDRRTSQFSANVVGDKPGRVCRYSTPPPGFRLVIATTAAERGYPESVYKERYEPLRLGGRDAERSGPQTGREDAYECRLLVDLAAGGLWFQFIRFGVDPGDPCADLTAIATEVVGMLPPGS